MTLTGLVLSAAGTKPLALAAASRFASIRVNGATATPGSSPVVAADPATPPSPATAATNATAAVQRPDMRRRVVDFPARLLVTLSPLPCCSADHAPRRTTSSAAATSQARDRPD